ncbi:MAG: hypothetical protein LBQ23_00540 [Puniceicoccales bacterium]|jgi:hypothetical protein|nr:hypothetical protein [Puniceicoccales bacterium]
MKLEPEKLDHIVESANTKDVKSSFAGRTFGIGAKDKTFMTKEVMSALDNRNANGKIEGQKNEKS